MFLQDSSSPDGVMDANGCKKGPWKALDAPGEEN